MSLNAPAPAPLPVPCAPGLPLLGALPRLRRRPLQVLAEAAPLGGVVLLGRKLGRRVYLVQEPELVCAVLRDRSGSYRMNRDNEVLDALVGKSLFTLEGEAWLARRRALQPVFRRPHLPRLLPHLDGVLEEMSARWEDAAREGRALELGAEMTTLALQFIVRAMFGVSFGANGAEMEARFRRGMALRERSRWGVLRIPFSWPTPANVEFRRDLRELDRVIYRIIAESRAAAAGAPGENLLELLLAARDSEGRPLNDVQLRDEVMTAFVIGHVTTAATMTWLHYLIATHPAVERRLREELASAGERGAEHGPYLAAVVRETLRLTPSVWLMTRRTLRPAPLGGHLLPAGSLVVLSQWATHRHPSLWEEAEAFRPERFMEAEGGGAPEHAFFPFGDGARRCIGADVAEMEIRVSLAALLRRFRIEPLPGQRVAPGALSTLKPDGPIHIRIHLAG